jgi:hypothetical protein
MGALSVERPIAKGNGRFRLIDVTGHSNQKWPLSTPSMTFGDETACSSTSKKAAR